MHGLVSYDKIELYRLIVETSVLVKLKIYGWKNIFPDKDQVLNMFSLYKNLKMTGAYINLRMIIFHPFIIMNYFKKPTQYLGEYWSPERYHFFKVNDICSLVFWPELILIEEPRMWNYPIRLICLGAFSPFFFSLFFLLVESISFSFSQEPFAHYFLEYSFSSLQSLFPLFLSLSVSVFPIFDVK